MSDASGRDCVGGIRAGKVKPLQYPATPNYKVLSQVPLHVYGILLSSRTHSLA